MANALPVVSATGRRKNATARVRMTAGTGVQHSEMNPSLEEPVHFLQIWILPEAQGLQPGYQEANFSDEDKRGGLRLIGSGRPKNGEVKIHQDVDLYATVLGPGDSAGLDLRPGRHAWIQLIRGKRRSCWGSIAATWRRCSSSPNGCWSCETGFRNR